MRDAVENIDQGGCVARWQGFYDELAAERYPALLAYAVAFTGQRATAEDLVQEAMVRTFSSPRRLSSARHAEHYVRRAIASVFVDDKRREQLFRRSTARLANADVGPDHAGHVDARDAVTIALASLSPQVRACVVLRYYDDLTMAQIADHLHLAVGTVKRYLHDGAEALRGELGADPDEERVEVLVTPRREK
jgi:RNA polymerase sigma-70 factor (ECF subfamily)